MAKENLIRTKALAILSKAGWVPWCPAKVRYQETDIFGIYDCICVDKEGKLLFIQWTSNSNMHARLRKICAFFEKHDLFIQNSQVWGYDQKKKQFRVFHITSFAKNTPTWNTVYITT